MKICIYGAGAIGGCLGVQLVRAGADVSLVARGAHLAAMRQCGLKLPALDAVLALVAQRAKLAGLYEGIVHPAETKTPVFA